MKDVACRDIEKYINNHNKECKKAKESSVNIKLNIENILGTNSQNIKGEIMFALNGGEILYYSYGFFLVQNLISKEYYVIDKVGSLNNSIIYMNRFYAQNSQLVITIEKSISQIFAGFLTIQNQISLSHNRESHYTSNSFKWRLIKISNKIDKDISHIAYHPKKNYVYLLAESVKQNDEDKRQQFVLVFDVNRECLILNIQIKPSIPKILISSIYITEQINQIYLTGNNYFRLWTINFNEKTMKESNYRNIERCIKGQLIIKIFNISINQIGVLTQKQIIIITDNQLTTHYQPSLSSMKKVKDKENVQLELQKSLNQIHKMKFLFDQEDTQNKIVENSETIFKESANDDFCCATDSWANQAKMKCIAVATNFGNVLIFTINNNQMKLISEFNNKKRYTFNCLNISEKGDIIVLSNKNYQHLYVINQFSLNHEDQDQIKPFWGAGQIVQEKIISIDSPVIHNRICTLGDSGTLKIWNFKGRDRKIIFEQKLINKPTQISMHPCGMLVAVNYDKQIKLFSILPNSVYEVVSAKTNYNSIQLQFTQNGNYLISNEQNLLIFYNPFTLKSLGYIQPSDIKNNILSFKASASGDYICYFCSDYSVYIQQVNLNYYNRFQSINPSHIQLEPYTCYHFDPQKQMMGSSCNNLFIGCSVNKYMVLYKNYGKQLIAEFPIIDCYITQMCQKNNLLFTATSKGTIRIYNWPILEQHCELELISLETRSIRYTQPFYEQFTMLSDSSINRMHGINFCNRLMITSEEGIVIVLEYRNSKGERMDESAERKKLIEIVNDTYFITKNQSDKRNRLIQKTQNDILKVQNEISKQKNVMEKKYKDEYQFMIKNYDEKSEIQTEQKKEYLKKIYNEINQLKDELKKKTQALAAREQKINFQYMQKKQYQISRNKQIQFQINKTVEDHKAKIKQQIKSHKQKIKMLKTSYNNKIKTMQQEFEALALQNYSHLLANHDINKPNLSRSMSRNSIKSKIEDTKIQTDFEFQNIQNDELMLLANKVEEIQNSNSNLQKILSEVQKKMKTMQMDDERLQRDFQKYFEEYNSSRFNNLSLHSQVLKMRTQLIERRQIMQNKQQIVNVAFQERQKLQNYKELVKGALTKLQEKKEQSHQTFVSKENQMSLIFGELINQMNLLEQRKRQENRLEQFIKITEHDKRQKEKLLDQSILQLKQLKKYLLLQGLNEDAEQKKIYLQQQNLLQSINFYKKRMSMQFIKQKKNKIIKKSALNLVLKHNKNLLEQCNQLREEAINYEHEIKSLGTKLGEANRMISIETKLKNQKTDVVEQRNQLEAIRAMFNDQLDSNEIIMEELQSSLKQI